MFLNTLDLASVAKLCSRPIFADAQDYYQSGRVLELLPKGKTISAKVSGIRVYNVYISEQNDLPLTATSDCNCDKNIPFCKHTVSVLIAWCTRSKRHFTTDQLKNRLSNHTQNELIAMLASACDHYPNLTHLLALDQLETESIHIRIAKVMNDVISKADLSQSQLITALTPFCREAESLFDVGEHDAARRAVFLVMKSVLDAAKQTPQVWEILPTNFLASCGRRYVQMVLNDSDSYRYRSMIRNEVKHIKRYALAQRVAFDFSALALIEETPLFAPEVAETAAD